MGVLLWWLLPTLISVPIPVLLCRRAAVLGLGTAPTHTGLQLLVWDPRWREHAVGMRGGWLPKESSCRFRRSRSPFRWGTGSGCVVETCQKEQSLLDLFSVVATFAVPEWLQGVPSESRKIRGFRAALSDYKQPSSSYHFPIGGKSSHILVDISDRFRPLRA